MQSSGESREKKNTYVCNWFLVNCSNDVSMVRKASVYEIFFRFRALIERNDEQGDCHVPQKRYSAASDQWITATLKNADPQSDRPSIQQMG